MMTFAHQFQLAAPGPTTRCVKTPFQVDGDHGRIAVAASARLNALRTTSRQRRSSNGTL
jgi:hypothetical protein